MRDSQAAPKLVEEPSARSAAEEALDVARYVTDMTAQLEAMASAARLELLAYFLGMAKAEAELFVRTHIPDADEAEETEKLSSPGMD